MNYKGFTLAEVLITLAIIGIVATLTLPALIENHNQKALATAKNVFLRRLQEATKQMNADGKMQGYSSTEEFASAFKGYMKNMQICKKGNTEMCFAAQIKIPTGEKNETFDIEELQTAKNFKKDYNTNIIGYSLPNGASMLLTYDPSCSYIDPFDSNADTTKCISMLYDVNGKKRPNEQGKDIFTLNGVQLSVPCKKKHEALNLTLACEDIKPVPMLNTCDGSGNEKYDTRGSRNSSCHENYWAGAKKACEDIGMHLTTSQELATIATYLYNQEDSPISVNENRENLQLDYERLNELSFYENVNESYWSSSYGVSTIYGTSRRFSDDGTTVWNASWVGGNTTRARCVK